MMIIRRFVYFIALLFTIAVDAADSLEIKEVAAGVYVHFGRHELPNHHNHGSIANIGFIIGERCVAVIDTGGNPEEGQALKKAISQVTDKPVCYVINTHVHPDHIYGNAAFKSKQVTFIGHYNLARAMASRGPFYLARAAEQLDIQLSADDLIAPDKPVQKHLLIDVGQRKLLLTAHPTAHTDNDLTIYDETTDTLWMSDLLFIGHIPVIDGSLKGWLKELERLEKNHYTLVIPGHGPLVTNWPEAMLPEKRYLTLLLNEIRTLIGKGHYLEDALDSVGISENNNWQLYDAFHRKNITTAFAELEWED